MNKLQNNTPTMPVSVKDKAKDWQLEILMEKLRSKASQLKTLPEISKNVRMTLLEKRYALDNVEKGQHQKCLDTLQHVIKVTGLQSMIERLESLTRQLGLRFDVEQSGVFIFSEMFYLEIILEPTGAVKDVKIHHEGKVEQQSCTELVNCLSRGDFTDFTTQLEGFVSIYQLNAEKKVKCKAFTALESLEADLCTLAQLQTIIKEPFNLLHKSPVGVLEKRRGGHPMKLTYFVSPYDLLNVDKHEIDAISIDNIISKGLGYWVTVGMEGSVAHKLQTSTLITVNRSMNGKSTPSYSPITSQNSAVVPACFTLKLNKPMPMCLSLIRKIQQIEQWPEIDSITPQPLLNLIVNHTSDGKMSSNNSKGLFVTLPDQTHCYCMTENRNMSGIFVTSIPFTHPAHVPNILMVLREQALFNTIIGSCVRPNSRQSFDNMTMFEVSALSSTQISISLEHPLEECMATADIDLSDISNLVCRIQNPGTPPPANAPDIVSELATKVLNKSFSIPVTLRSVIKMWERQAAQPNLYPGQENFSLPLGSIDPGGHKGPGPGPGLAEFGGLQDKIKQEPGVNGPQGQGHHQITIQEQQGMWNESMMSANFQNIPPSDRVLTNIELTNILSDSPDKSSTGKRQKRKATDDLWKASKRKVGAGTEDSELVETSSCDSTSRSTPISQETEIATPNSGSQSDLELSNVDSSDYLANVEKAAGEFHGGHPETVDMEEILSTTPRKALPEPSPSSSSSVVSDLSDKNLVPPNVSITPISSSPSPTYSEKRTSIEIIPISQSAVNLMPTSITITPIAASSKPTEDKKEKKSSRSSREDREKKRKRKRDESPMGPPEKVPPKQDPLSKPVSVSIKPAESPPLSSSTPTSPSMMRKFSPSPTSSRPLSLSGKLSPNLLKPKSSSSSSTSHHSPSPKNSPAHVPSSPKHSGISSPKHHVTSPKHPSASGSGKPSMSTLKNAANSPSGKSSSEKSRSRESSREKDKSRSIFGGGGGSSSSSTKTKSSSSIKVKPLDLNLGSIEGASQESLPSPSADSKTNPNTLRNRKGSLSAIVDKLNIRVNAQHSDIPTDLSSKASSKAPSKDGKSGGKVGDVKNSEYMVKTSSDGMKLTINKPRTKENKTSSSVSASNSGGSSSSSAPSNNPSKPPQTTTTVSPKVHTGLKPGVNSGPASKKPQQLQKSSSSSSIPNSSTAYNPSSSIKTSSTSSSSNKQQLASSGASKVPSSNLPKSISKPTTSPKTSSGSITDLSRNKDRMKPSKSSSEKSIFSSLKERGKSSPTPNDSESIYKLQPKVDPYTSALMMEGMMKTLDKNFQIPKLSDKKKNEMNNVNRSTVDTKIFDMMVKNDIKYPLSIPAMNSLDQKIRNNMSMMGPGKTDDLDDKKKDGPQNLSGSSN